MNEDLKRTAGKAIDSHRTELVALSHKIHQHPELGFAEVQAAAWLVEMCRSLGWEAAAGICDLPTAWDARVPSPGHGPTVAFLAEYDALPEIGHACGHNIMATAPIGAAIGVQAVIERLHGQVKLLGTPAEEGGGGKVLLAQRGALAGVDLAMMVHPSDYSAARGRGLALEHLEVEFRGRAAHAAASPEKGINALNALVLSFNHLDALRQHIPATSRIHGIINRGGDAPNVVPDYTKGTFIVRAADNVYLDELMGKVGNCFEAGALATGAQLRWQPVSPRYETILSNPTMSELYHQAMELLGVDCPMDSDRVIGSTDMGNVSWQVPSIHSIIKIVDGVPNHTREFAQAAVSEQGDRAIMDAAKAMAFTAIDLLSQPDLVEQAKHELRDSAASSANEGQPG
ncbi:MAG: M20 family metallopeptidase [Chloroflexota bacterium]|nr:M20 family metallopeptidase [Chloroflexota bacterium]